MKRWQYPFSAITGQAPMKTALLLTAVDPTIGGVLIRGAKGTGKSTAARALAAVLPEIEAIDGSPLNSSPDDPVASIDPEPFEAGQSRAVVHRPTPFVELPLNATEDRVAGALQIEKTLRTGMRQFEPGLLAAANRGVLYVDEVNLLDDHLVDLLLDAAASGVNVVEREGFSFTHPARFILIGTMNPEEGELRPQFLDRFGLCVTLQPIHAPSDREIIIRQRLAFDSNPSAFVAQWQAAELWLVRQLRLAREHLEQVVVPDAIMTLAARLPAELQVPTHRADITLVKAARAHAAFLEKPAVELDDLINAATMALPHRLSASPLDSAHQLQQRIDHAFAAAARTTACDHSTTPAPDEGSTSADAAEDIESMAEQMQVPGVCAAGSILFDFIKKKTLKLSSTPTTY
jgi:magnesium chelatase subunit I